MALVVLVVLTCALIDAALMAVGVVGVAALARLLPDALAWVTGLGVVFLIGYGMTAARRAYKPRVLQLADAQAAPHSAAISLGAWAAEGVEAKIGPSDAIVFDDFADEYLDIWREIGEK